MKVPKSYMGKYVEIIWRDPNVRRAEMHEVLKGMDALATWSEYGVIQDITDGVILIVHSSARNVGTDPKVTDEISYTAVHEALVEKIVVFEPRSEDAGTTS